MRTRLQLVVAFCLLGALVVAGAFLPARIAAHLDGLLLDKVETQALAPDEGMLLAPATSSLIGRMKLFTLPHSEVLTTQLETGERLDRDTAWKALDRELDDLRARGLYLVEAPPLDRESALSFSAGPKLWVAPARPDLSGIIWEIQYMTPELSGAFYLDDESEKIISYSVKYEGVTEKLFGEQSGERWLDYLEIDAEGLQVSQESSAVPLENAGGGSAGAGGAGGGSAGGGALEPLAPTAAPVDSVGSGTVGFWERFSFTLPAKLSPLRFYCGQHRDEASGVSVVEITLLNDAVWPPDSVDTAEPVVVTQ
jgi:hypothetical protein